MKTVQTLQALSATLLAIGMVIILPLFGIMATGLPIERYLEFPPHTHYVEHAGFSWPVCIALALLIFFVTLPFIIRVLFFNRTTNAGPGAPKARQLETPLLTPALLSPAARRFPIWGWLGLFFGIGAWILAWTRFDWFAALQTFTFSPLWFAYIIIVNALTWRRTRQCMLTNRPRYFLLLFPVSALFWWLFEYLNRFVQNWYYLGIGSLTPPEYFLFATLPFSTVLPAVMGTFQLLATYPRLYTGLTDFFVMPRINSRYVAVVALTLSAAGLAGIGLWPDYLFPLLWLAPLGVLASLQALAGRTSLFADLVRGDWRRIVLLALSALVCGFFWEMWNFYSLAKWIYAVPFVNRFHIFEMPALGYAGYLPFGLECALIAECIANWCDRHSSQKLPNIV
ncbi:MAG: hypothetical protein L6437_07560 [Kiritimatiellae bacterium]|nr:hypothetical protein [Verrucomicrobiota bacterium]MBU4365959.1 hypothetical protein [Verrucomicrobiota bacterium]MCG2660086.1 hypothetical protein [Kiritimatiellia bacterium]